jgi:hypothetical protein
MLHVVDEALNEGVEPIGSMPEGCVACSRKTMTAPIPEVAVIEAFHIVEPDEGIIFAIDDRDRLLSTARR